MNKMFYKCNSLTFLNIFQFDITKVNNMEEIFFECKSLNKINISENFISKIKDNYKIIEGINKNCEYYCNGNKIILNNDSYFNFSNTQRSNPNNQLINSNNGTSISQQSNYTESELINNNIFGNHNV